MAKAGACLLLALALLSWFPPVAADSGPVPAARDAALAYLERQGEGGPYPVGLAPYAVETAAAAGLDAWTWPSAAHPAIASIAVPDADAPLLNLVRAAHAVAVAGGDLQDWQGQDLQARILDAFDGQQFGNAALLNDDAFAIPALLAAGMAAEDERIVAAARWLAAQRNADLGWGYAIGASSGTDMTGMVLAAVLPILPPAEGEALQEAARSFVLTAHAGAGFAERPGGPANCDSSVWALRVLGDVAGTADWQALLAMQNTDGGFAYQSGQDSNALCTAEAATLLADAGAGRVPVPRLEDAHRGAPLTAALVPLAAALAVAWRSDRFRHA